MKKIEREVNEKLYSLNSKKLKIIGRNRKNTRDERRSSAQPGLRIRFGMAFITCDICYEEFSASERIPKVLVCGHTFCSVCLTKILQSHKFCPTCKGVLLTKSLKEYPTNFAILNLTEKFNDKVIGYDSHIVSVLKCYEQALLGRSEMLLRSIVEKTSLSKIIANDMKKVQQMILSDTANKLNPKDVENLIAELKADIDKIDEATNNNASFSLLEVANRIHKGETIYAFEMVRNTMPRYGKITIEDGKLNVQALSLTKIDKNASVVSFQDIKKCITDENFLTFIKIGGKTLHFSIINSSAMVSRFIQLCTGETGPMFKSVSGAAPSFRYIGKEHIRIAYYMLYDVDTEFFYNYDILFTNKQEFLSFSQIEGNIVVQMLPNGNCDIRRYISDGKCHEHVVARTVYSQSNNIDNLKPTVIAESGISLTL